MYYLHGLAWVMHSELFAWRSCSTGAANAGSWSYKYCPQHGFSAFCWRLQQMFRPYLRCRKVRNEGPIVGVHPHWTMTARPDKSLRLKPPTPEANGKTADFGTLCIPGSSQRLDPSAVLLSSWGPGSPGGPGGFNQLHQLQVSSEVFSKSSSVMSSLLL